MTRPLFPVIVAWPTADDHWLSFVGESVPVRGMSPFERTSIESLTRRMPPEIEFGCLRVGEDRGWSPVGLELSKSSVLLSKTMDGMR